MSQQHGTGSGPSSSRLHDASPCPYPTAPARTTPFRPALATSSASGGSLFDAPDARGPALPPILLPSEPTPPRSEGRTPRSLGVHSILNPSRESGAPRGHVRSASQMDSPSSPIERVAATSTDYFSQQGSQGAADGRRAAAAANPQRRILSPRSPLYRSQSLGMIRPPTGTINAQETPFLSPGAQEYRADVPTSTTQPPLPTPPAAQRTAFNFPRPSAIATPSVPQSHSRRTSVGISQPPQPPSATASPGGMHPQAGQASPFGEVGRPSSHVPCFSSAPSSTQTQSPSTQDSERSYGIPVASTGQSNYQLLTLETNQGHVQIPVDVQAASKVADEKRKRNAGASARFRARRKEKEKEASTTIARLEQQLREANEDVEFYRRERDYLAQLVYQIPGGDRHFPRPPSPRLRRMSMQTQGSTGGGSSGHGSTSAGSTPSMAYSAYPPTEQRGDQRVAEPERNVRRRTTSYLPPPHAAAAPGPSAQPAMGCYPQSSLAPLAAPQIAPQSHPSSRPLPPGAIPQQLQHAAPSQALYPRPQAPERAERSWPPQPHSNPRGPRPPPGPL